MTIEKAGFKSSGTPQAFNQAISSDFASTAIAPVERSCDGAAVARIEAIVSYRLVSGADIRTRAIVIQQKTGKPVQFELTPDVRVSPLTWIDRRGGTVHDFAFPSRVDHAGHLSTRQYARLVDEWVDAVGLRRAEYSMHSLHRTKASMIYKAVGNLGAIQILLGHSKIKNTVRYLGVDIDDVLVLAERTEI